MEPAETAPKQPGSGIEFVVCLRLLITENSGVIGKNSGILLVQYGARRNQRIAKSPCIGRYTMRASCILTFAILTGCVSNANTPPLMGGGWNQLKPPQENVLGHMLSRVEHGDDIEEAAYSDIDRRVITSKVAGTISSADHDNLKAELGATVRSVASIGANFDYVSSERFDSSDWVVRSIDKPLRGAKINTWIVYKCLMASEYSFEVKDNVGGGVEASLSKDVAEKFGVEDASVKVSSLSDEPDHYRFTISNPNVCLAYRAIKYTTIGKGARNTITKGDLFTPRFILAPGDLTNERTPDLAGYNEVDKPKFFLRAVAVKLDEQSNVKGTDLEICQIDRTSMDGLFDNSLNSSKQYECRVIPRNMAGGWNFTYDLGTFDAREVNQVALIKLTIRADDLAGGKIDIRKAELVSALFNKTYSPK
jgi:hypothetical protein